MKYIKMRIQILMFFIVLFSSFISCKNESTSMVTVDFKESIDSKALSTKNKEIPIFIAIASMTSPKETMIYYKQLINYISKKLGRKILIKQKKTYWEVNNLLKTSQVDFAFICAGAYIEMSENNLVQVLVAPKINGKTYYQAYLISRDIPQINEFRDFKGMSFAYTDPLSNTGHTYPRKLLKESQVDESSFFSKTHYTYGHDVSIHMVNSGAIDGASVHGLIYDYISQEHPERVLNTKVIQKSAWFGMPPVVAPLSLDKKTTQKYRNLFIDIHNDSIGLSILQKLNIEKFVILDDSIYHNVRKLKKYVEAK